MYQEEKAANSAIWIPEESYFLPSQGYYELDWFVKKNMLDVNWDLIATCPYG